jgi:hypothetical protein
MEPGMEKALSGMEQGWTESLERLEQLVESMQTK